MGLVLKSTPRKSRNMKKVVLTRGGLIQVSLETWPSSMWLAARSNELLIRGWALVCTNCPPMAPRSHLAHRSGSKESAHSKYCSILSFLTGARAKLAWLRLTFGYILGGVPLVGRLSVVDCHKKLHASP